MLKNIESVVCCGGTASKHTLREYTLNVIIGGGDFLSPKYKKLFFLIVHQMADQEANDRTKATHFLQKKGFRRVTIVGATGKREGHTLENTSLLIGYMKDNIEVYTITDYGVFIPARDTQAFASHSRQ